MEFIKEEYHKRGFTEVVTPNMFNRCVLRLVL